MDRQEFADSLRSVTRQTAASDADVQTAAFLINDVLEKLCDGLLLPRHLHEAEILGGGEILWKSRPVKLTACQYRMMHCLWCMPNTAISHRALFDAMHNATRRYTGNGEYGYRTNVRSCIRNIRARFREVDADFCAIQSRARLGYCWSVPAAAD